jgi:hypothetical protein
LEGKGEAFGLCTLIRTMVYLCSFIFISLKCWYSHESVSSMWTSFFKGITAEERLEDHWHRGTAEDVTTANCAQMPG